MARNFRRPRTAQPIADLNVTNLIDLGFMLLIIFMVASPLMQEQTISVKLPAEAKSPQERPDPTLRVETITIDAKGNYFLGGRPMTFAELQVQLRAFAGEPKQPIIRIAGDGRGTLDKVVRVLSELKKYNLTRLDFATAAEN